MKYLLSVLLSVVLSATFATAQNIIPLYEGTIPNSKPGPDLETGETRDSILRVANISRPTLTAYMPAKPNGAAVIICPGGGYRIESVGYGGADVARKFTEAGVTAFVLKYRLPDTATMIDKEIGPLQDAQRAIQLVRENAAFYKVAVNRIGILDFSAGGHLASTAGTRFKKAYIANPNNTSLRPDFMILVYPVISFSDSLRHVGSRNRLIGEQPSDDKKREYSNELHVDTDTPPSFLVHAKDDPIKFQNSIVFADALKLRNVPVELFLYEKGGHGYGMNNKTSPVKWMDLAEDWMRKMKFM